jgi:hypothetical protein
MYEINYNENLDRYEGVCIDDDFEAVALYHDQVCEIMEKHESELKKQKEKEQKWLTNGNIRERLIELNNNIISLASVAYDTSKDVSKEDVKNKARLEGEYRAYLQVNNMLEDILMI